MMEELWKTMEIMETKRAKKYAGCGVVFGKYYWKKCKRKLDVNVPIYFEIKIYIYLCFPIYVPIYFQIYVLLFPYLFPYSLPCEFPHICNLTSYISSEQ